MSRVPEKILRIAAGRPALSRALDALVEEWDPDPPPETVSMAELGRATVRDANELGRVEVQAILAEVEQMLTHGSEQEKNAAATGFLEATASAVDSDSSKHWVLACAGERSKEYLKAWDEFCGIKKE